MTSSFVLTFWEWKKYTAQSKRKKKATRLKVHLTFAFIFLLCILMFKWIDDKSIIDVILKLAGYTYGPLLGLFSFGILTHRIVNDRWVLLVCLLSPLVILGIDFINNPEWFGSKLGFAQDTITSLSHLSQRLFSGFKIGIEILILNGILTFIGLWFISKPRESSAHA